MSEPLGYEFICYKVDIPHNGTIQDVVEQMGDLDLDGWEVLTTTPSSADAFVWYVFARRAKDD